MGTRFPVEGESVRLFMQWGEGLSAQHLDMDLSCKVAYQDGTTTFCSFSQLVIPGCKHSGDIQRIPEKVGTAEYIELRLDELARSGAKFVSFTCNAYTPGSLAPNMVVGWMDSTYPIEISSSGVAYDPSCVQQQIRIAKVLTKGLVFGVLDIEKREIIWLEMSFSGQLVGNLDTKGVESMLARLSGKFSVGNLLRLKAKAQELVAIDDKEKADESYDQQWAYNPARVKKLLLD